MPPGASSDPQGWPNLYGDYLYRFALLRTREASVAEEMVQETFLAALQARDRFAGQSTERSWLVGIMKHKIVDHFRKVTREIPTDDMEHVGAGEDVDGAFDQHGHWKPGASAPMDWPGNPSGMLEQKQFWDVLKRCLGELPPRMAQVFSLREVDEVSSEEICTMLGITPNNLWVLLHRSRKHLRQCLETHHFGPQSP
ncbi:MAG: sigma-70 family RNA polymerase sigma factor [Nitrospirae bacterium]|nr:sigma-70 family RNA polymerase sigma factor [Nitrospirota bacterium]